MSLTLLAHATEDQPNLSVAIRLDRAKHLLAQEVPMTVVARDVGLSLTRVQAAAKEGNWLRRSRRDPYGAAVRIEAIREHEHTGSMTRAARMLGIGRTTLTRWLRAARPASRQATVRWRCYDCAPYGMMVEGSTCPNCGTVRTWSEQEQSA